MYDDEAWFSSCWDNEWEFHFVKIERELITCDYLMYDHEMTTVIFRNVWPSNKERYTQHKREMEPDREWERECVCLSCLWKVKIALVNAFDFTFFCSSVDTIIRKVVKNIYVYRFFGREMTKENENKYQHRCE